MTPMSSLKRKELTLSSNLGLLPQITADLEGIFLACRGSKRRSISLNRNRQCDVWESLLHCSSQRAVKEAATRERQHIRVIPGDVLTKQM